MRKNIFTALFIIFSIISCTNLNLKTEITDGIKFLNHINFNKKTILDIGRKIAKYENIKKGNSKIDFKQVIYKNAKLEIFSPKYKKNNKVIYWVHGGAFYYPLSNIFRNVALYMLSINDNYDIALLDYTLLPEAKYPIANIETEEGLEYLETKYKFINMLGDSAGLSLIHI